MSNNNFNEVQDDNELVSKFLTGMKKAFGDGENYQKAKGLHDNIFKKLERLKFENKN